MNKTNREDTKYLKVSPHTDDLGNLIGKQPSEISLSDLQDLGHPKSLTKVIRAKCKDCCAGYEAEIRKCVQYDCPLWPFRMGKNPFHGRSKQSRKES